MIQRLVAFWTLPTTEQRFLLQSLCLLGLTGLGLRLLGFNRCYVGLSRWGNSTTKRRVLLTQSATTTIIRRTLRCLAMVVRHSPYTGNCLSRSLTLWWLLQRQHIPCDLRIGVRQHTDYLEAHAWVEYQGYPLNESSRVYQEYTAFSETIMPTRPYSWPDTILEEDLQ